jgi:2-iminobutanoate/2-iminopropanoate deaminase
MKLRTLLLIVLLPVAALAQQADRKFITSDLATDTDKIKAGLTPEAEAKDVMEQIKGTVDKAGMSMDDIVSMQVFCTDLTLYDAFNGVYRTYFKGNFPARAFIGGSKLLFGARFEVLGIAVKKNSRN